MKKVTVTVITIFALIMLSTVPAEAYRGGHGGHYYGHHNTRVVHVYHSRHYHGGHHHGNVWVPILATAASIALIDTIVTANHRDDYRTTTQAPAEEEYVVHRTSKSNPPKLMGSNGRPARIEVGDSFPYGINLPYGAEIFDGSTKVGSIKAGTRLPVGTSFRITGNGNLLY